MLAWRAGTVLKLFHPQFEYAVEMEHARAQAVHALGAPCPAVFELAGQDGRRGVVYERIDGPLLLDSLRDRDDESIARVAAQLAELHASLHALRVPEDSALPKLREAILRWLARLPEERRARAEAALAELPSDDTGLCHMDLHPGNVIVAGGRLVVVDWVNACSGALALDVARSIVLMAWQGATRRDGGRQRVRLALTERYRAEIARHLEPEQIERALPFASDALLRAEPGNPYADELRAGIPWL